jgi:UDP-glucose 4-epimerase
MKLFVTGASGFIGAETVRLALDAGHEIVAPVLPGDDASRLRSLAGRFVRAELDLRDRDRLRTAMLMHRPDIILHLGWSGVENGARFDGRQITDNIEMSCALVEAAAAAGAKAFVAMGSQAEYGAGSDMREDTLPLPTTLYGAAKVATLYLTRQLAAQAGMRHAWLRLFSTYGPGDNSGWLIPTLIREMLAGRRPKTTLGTQYWDWLHVEDVARAVLAVATTPLAEGVFNLGSGQATRVRDAVEAIRDLARPGMELVFGEIPFRSDQVMHMQADNSRLREATGWEPRIGLSEGLLTTVEWYRARRV